MPPKHSRFCGRCMLWSVRADQLEQTVSLSLEGEWRCCSNVKKILCFLNIKACKPFPLDTKLTYVVPLRHYIVYSFHIQNFDFQVKWWTVNIVHYIVKILDRGAVVCS